MNIKILNKATIRSLATASAISLAISLQAFAEPQLEQPNSVSPDSTRTTQDDVAQDQEVTPAGCTDSCCGGGACNGNGCCGNCCCEAVCCPKRVTEEVKKHCWKVKSEMICIPGWRFECNWRKNRKNCCNCGDTCCSSGCCDSGTPTCGRVRCINVLEKHEYTCEECGYEWEVKCVRSSNGCCHGKGGCCCPSCGCAAKDQPETDVQLTSATAVADEETEKQEEPSLVSRLLPWLK